MIYGKSDDDRHKDWERRTKLRETRRLKFIWFPVRLTKGNSKVRGRKVWLEKVWTWDEYHPGGSSYCGWYGTEYELPAKS